MTYEIPSSALTALKWTPEPRCICGYPKIYHVDARIGHPFTPKVEDKT